MAIPAEVLTQPVTLSDAAIAQLKPLIADALAKPDNTAASLALRVYVAGASCSGTRYGLALDDKFGADDTAFEQGGVKLVIDGDSLPMLTGSVVDFVEGPNGKGFTVNNPNAQSGCGSCGHGCGSSDDESCCE
jgi:iron-sulfur cluster assembly accessory protein